jgi:uncharacterized protein (UPF0332 family)
MLAALRNITVNPLISIPETAGYQFQVSPRYFERGKKLVRKEFSIGESALSDANAGFEEKRYNWSTIQAYYAMFHTARALVYSKSYREKSHYCLSIALKAYFIDEGKLDIQSGRNFLNAMNLREAADYEAEFSETGAKAVIDAAERFIMKAKDLIEK